jgi:hypothetical protein
VKIKVTQLHSDLLEERCNARGSPEGGVGGPGSKGGNSESESSSSSLLVLSSTRRALPSSSLLSVSLERLGFLARADMSGDRSRSSHQGQGKDWHLPVKVVPPGRNNCAQASCCSCLLTVWCSQGRGGHKSESVQLNRVNCQQRKSGIDGGRERLFVVQEHGDGDNLVGKIIEDQQVGTCEELAGDGKEG